VGIEPGATPPTDSILTTKPAEGLFFQYKVGLRRLKILKEQLGEAKFLLLVLRKRDITVG
jgi:hypothetical protein